MNDNLATTAVLDNKGSNDGTMNVNTDTKSVEGKINKALDFDGTNDYVDVPYDSSLGITDAITISAWIKTSDNTIARQNIVDKRAASTRGNYVLRLSSGYLRFLFYNGGWNWLTDDTTKIENDTWYHIAITYNKENIRLYVNGIEVKSGEETLAMIDSSSIVSIGRQRYSDDSLFKGKIDDVRIYDTAISPYYVKLLYNNGAGTEDENIQSNTLLLGCNF